jgi:hypothetical protein
LRGGWTGRACLPTVPSLPLRNVARRAVSSSLPGLLVGIDHLTRLVLRRRYHDLGREVPELADVIALDVIYPYEKAR